MKAHSRRSGRSASREAKLATTPERVLIGQSALHQIVRDATLLTAMRFEAADWIHMQDDEDGAEAFEILATDPGLADTARLRAARELATVGEERAAEVYPGLCDAPSSSDTTAYSSPTAKKPPGLR